MLQMPELPEGDGTNSCGMEWGSKESFLQKMLYATRFA
jgi:hypothetical protein